MVNKKLLKELLYSLNKKANRGDIKEIFNTKKLIDQVFDTTTCCDNPEMFAAKVTNLHSTCVGGLYETQCKNCGRRP